MDWKNIDDDDYEKVPRFWFSSRFAMALLGFVGFLSMSSQRMCINVAMDCMLNHTALHLLQQQQPLSRHIQEQPPVSKYMPDISSSYYNVTVAYNSSLLSVEDIDMDGTAGNTEHISCAGIPDIYVLNPSQFQYSHMGEFTWPETTQAAITNSFYWGYVLTQVPSGWLAQRYGGKRVFGFLLLASSISTALIPIAARTHLFLLLTLRFIGGIGSGATFPAMHTLWGKWAPPQERSLLASITYAGSLTGSVVIFPIAGLLCEYGLDGKGFDGGWPAIFYIFGALGVVWFILWMVCASESPSEHGRINALERQYIIDTLLTETVQLSADSQEKMVPVPWSKALTSFPFIAIVLCNFTYEWGIYTFEKLFPDYQKKVLKLDIPLNSIFALLPYLGLWLVVMASGGGADRLQSHGVLSTTATRKVMQLIGAIVPACMIAATGFIDCSQWTGTISFMTIGLSFCGFQYNGFLVNHLDIAPPFAGILMGIANAIGSTASFWLPYFLHIIMSTSQDVNEQWQTMFLITSSLYVFSTAFYLLCGSGQMQTWAMEPCRTVHTVESPSETLLLDRTNRPNSLVASSPTANQSPVFYNAKPSFDVYSSDTLRRNNQHDLSKPIVNHLTPPSGNSPTTIVTADEMDTLNRKSSNKSNTSSRTKNETDYATRRTDHERDRDYHRPRQRDRDSAGGTRDRDSTGGIGGSTKRYKGPSLRSRPEDSLEIYESLSESPV